VRERLRQSVGFVDVIASLAGGGAVIYVVWFLAEGPMTYIGDNAQTEAVRRSHQWTELLLTNLPIVFALITMLGGIAFAVYQTRFA